MATATELDTSVASRATSVSRSVLLYELLRAERPGMRLSDLSRLSGLPKSTTHRLLKVLLRAELVVRQGVSYAAVPRKSPVMTDGRGESDLIRRLAPLAGEAMVLTRLTASLAVLDSADVVFLHRVYGYDLARTRSDSTGRAPAGSTAAGRLLLAQDIPAAVQPTVRRRLDIDTVAALHSDLLRIRQRQIAVRRHAGFSCLAVLLVTDPGRLSVALTVRGEAATIDDRWTVQVLCRIADKATRKVTVNRVG
jgi:DNA-binding IclR family transcriptional regulator